ncbi:head completion/stabilization protein [Glaesserella parasuis]|nr:head completion/stabilization protein [Glaesserella parasuis]
MSHVINIPKVVVDKNQVSSPTQSTISNNGFFPDIELIDVRHAMRADGTVTDERLTFAVIEAMATVNAELHTLQMKYATFDDIPSDHINGENLMITRYKRAVFCFAMANLYERYRSFDSTKEGAEKAEQFENSVDDLRRDARFAIRDMLKRKRWTSELI